MTTSVNTNASALVALQNLNRTSEQLAGVQDRISTGLKIASAKDNASVWAIAQGQRADTASLGAVKSSLDRASSIADVAMTAGQSISDLLNEIKAKVVAAQDPSLDTASRAAINNDFRALLRQVTDTIANAEFDGANILDSSLPSGIKFLANADADSFITLSSKNLSLGGSIITIASTATISTLTAAALVLTQIATSISNTNSALGQMGAQAKQIEAHNVFISKLSDVLETGLGNLVDADMAKESARLQALQVAQQLGVQALSIANSSPQMILSLFRS
ncbi:MAG: flagellin [Caulobacteraceae bacterium]